MAKTKTGSNLNIFGNCWIKSQPSQLSGHSKTLCLGLTPFELNYCSESDILNVSPIQAPPPFVNQATKKISDIGGSSTFFTEIVTIYTFEAKSYVYKVCCGNITGFRCFLVFNETVKRGPSPLSGSFVLDNNLGWFVLVVIFCFGQKRSSFLSITSTATLD